MKITAIMCVYYKDSYSLFMSALHSVKNQTLKASQFILVVDGAYPDHYDLSEDKLKEFLQITEVIIVKLSKNMGHGLARRIGMMHVSNALVAICDSDDINHKDRFKLSAEFLMSNVDVSIVGSQVEERSIEVPNGTPRIREVPCDHESIIDYMSLRCPLNQMTVMFRYQDIQEVGGYHDFYHNEDYYLWIRLANAGKRFANLPTPLVVASMDSSSYGRRAGIKYFMSEVKIQSLLLRYSLTSLPKYCVSISLRVIIQLLLPNKIRSYIFMNFLRRR